MDIIYYCYGGAHSSVIAAAIHVGMLPNDRIPTILEIFSTPYFDITPNEKIGDLLYMGMDTWGNDIYCMGWGIFKENILSTLLFLKKNDSDFIFDNTIFIYALPVADRFIKLGGFLSRRLGITLLGRLLIIKGVKRKYLEFIELVHNVKNHNIRKMPKD